MTEFEKKRKKNYTNEYKEKQLLIDREKKIHSAELYAVWNLKTYILNQVAKVNPFKSEFFIYTDSGAWRGSQFNNWPDESFIHKVKDKIQDRVLYGQVGYDPKDNNLNKNLIQGFLLIIFY